ncbi:MAG: prolipoprotein diacylglyceryl transferase [Paludibacteraceae bacterium]|nr:prolipoprotein diacylglyceryl transferase [Paludibacteraceae bacterium]
MLQYIVWDIDPVLFSLGPLSVRWYGVLWAIGIYLTLIVVGKTYKREELPEKYLDKLFVYTLVGAIVGARLGHCFFYEWHLLKEPFEFLGITFNYGNEYLLKPWKLIAIWEGGLASHGGTIGILTAIFLYHKKVLPEKSLLWILDRLVIGIAICGACIRLGNLMNSEIFGYPTTLPWGFMFIRSYEWQVLYAGQACHPTQIYEMIYCLVTFALLLFMYWKTNIYKKEGIGFGTFMICIFGTRFVLEFIKLNQESFEASFTLNMGQVLSIPFIAIGFWCVFRALSKKENILK